MTGRDEHAVLRFLMDVGDRLDGVADADVDRALKIAVRLTREFFGADQACLAVLEAGATAFVPRYGLPRGSQWDPALFEKGREQRPVPPARDHLKAFVERRRRRWGMLVLRRTAGFERGQQGVVERVASLVSRKIGELDARRIVDVRARIDRKILEQLRTKDLFYHILDGLRSLTHYDHSSALLIFYPESQVLEVVAEQIAWRRGGSSRVGLAHRVDEDAMRLLGSGEVFGFDREGDEWTEWQDRPSAALVRLLDSHTSSPLHPNEIREASILGAPLTVRENVLGVLKVSSRHAGALGAYEAELVRRFLPHLAVAIRNLTRTESLELSLLEAVKKQAMADLALGISHDINNAVGQVLPLVQQMLVEEKAKPTDPQNAALCTDLGTIENAMQVCRRITTRMLSFASGAVRGSGAGNVARALDSTLALLKDGLERRGIEVRHEVDGELPSVRGSQADLDQLLLNLTTNARDAMLQGGVLSIEARTVDDHVVLIVGDTGAGIPAENLKRIWETFFSTKKGGTGLGLPICQQIVWRMQGKIDVESQVGDGTRVHLRLPVATVAGRADG